MYAVKIHRHGSADELRYEEAADPGPPASREAIVRLKAAAVNRHDVAVRCGATRGSAALPRIPGCDGAGVVSDVGEKVRHLSVGDEVCLFPYTGCGACEYCTGDREQLCASARFTGDTEDGTYADYVRVPAANCYPLPGRMGFVAAAAFPMAFLSAWHMVVTLGALQPGESILIRDVGDDISTAALQIAVSIGARAIVAADDDRQLEAASAMGAEFSLNSSATDVGQEVRRLTGKRGADAVLDSVGGNGWGASLASMAKGSRLLTCGATAGGHPPTNLRRIFWNHLRVVGSTLGTRKEFAEVSRFLDETGVRPVVQRVFPLSEAAAAHRCFEASTGFGKIVLKMEV